MLSLYKEKQTDSADSIYPSQLLGWKVALLCVLIKILEKTYLSATEKAITCKSHL